VVAAALLLALERHLDGRRRAAWALLLVAALARPEAWAFLGAYTFYAWPRGERDPRLAVLALVVVPLLWIGADWWGSGDPFHAGEVARSVDANLSWHELLAAGADLAGPPALVLAGAACVAGWRRGDRRVLGLAGSVLAWTALACGLVAAGGPGAPRFLMPAVAGACVLAGAGAVRTVQAAGEFPLRRFALAAVIALASAPAALPRAAEGADQLALAERRAVFEADLRQAVRAASGRLRSCGPYLLPADLGWLEGAVAWELDVSLESVAVVRRRRGLPAVLAQGGPVLLIDQQGRSEPLMSRASQGDAVLSYRIPQADRCVALLSPLPARPQAIGGRPLQVKLLGRAVHWRVWAIRRERS
jgi:hypothetical protein